tara:strand:+ start:1106 stop:2152 length:1047 start_codon:yes stop_codon:yes gene_type:complete
MFILKSPIFYDKNILSQDKLTIDDYYNISKKLFNSKEGKNYKDKTHNKVLLQKNNFLVMYMNFKSHNILEKTGRNKLYKIIETYNPDVICLSEALHPVNIPNNKNTKVKTTIFNIEKLTDDTIIGPYEGAKQFEIKKIELYNGYKKIKGVWKSFFLNNGYKYIVFGNPKYCPWGNNWGNCIITKKKPEYAFVLQMGHYGKKEFGKFESRNMIIVKINNQYIGTTHLDNNNSKARSNQAKEIIDFFNKNKIYENITLVGDLNAINKKSYNQRELNLLKKRNINQEELPYDAVDIINKSNLFGPKPINTGQKYESLFQKCVTHVYSNKLKNTEMIFTDTTDFDHQPIFIW